MQNRLFHILAVALTVAVVGPISVAETGESRRAELVARGVERALSQVLDVSVSIDSVTIDREAQRLVFENLTIANPGGFSADYALKAGRVEVDAAIDGLFDREPVLKSVVAKDVGVHSETRLDRGNNLQKLLSAARDFQRRPAARLMRRGEREWRIEEALLDGGEAALTTIIVERNTTRRPLGRMEFDLRDSEGEGLTPAEAMRRVLSQLIGEMGGVDLDNGVNGVGGLLDGLRRLR